LATSNSLHRSKHALSHSRHKYLSNPRGASEPPVHGSCMVEGGSRQLAARTEAHLTRMARLLFCNWVSLSSSAVLSAFCSFKRSFSALTCPSPAVPSMSRRQCSVLTSVHTLHHSKVARTMLELLGSPAEDATCAAERSALTHARASSQRRWKQLWSKRGQSMDWVRASHHAVASQHAPSAQQVAWPATRSCGSRPATCAPSYPLRQEFAHSPVCDRRRRQADEKACCR
jgi:hypothetical protein